MASEKILATFLEEVPAEYPKHMLCYFANNAARGIDLPFTTALLRVLETAEETCPGYSRKMLARIGAIHGTGADQYEALLSILAEVYVTGGLIEKADRDGDALYFVHEPAMGQQKNPEFEVRVGGQWCAVEVKAARLIKNSQLRAQSDWQFCVRLPKGSLPLDEPTLPRDNPVKDFLISANQKFKAYEEYRCGAFRALVIVWDDFCNEPIAALTSPVSGLLTPFSFNRDDNGDAVVYSYVDGILIVRHQHQLIRATRCEPHVDGIKHAFQYHHAGFPPKAFISGHGGRAASSELMLALNARVLSDCDGAE